MPSQTLEGLNELTTSTLSDGRQIIWRDESSPYDNTLHIFLLNPDGKVLDAIEANALMAEGILEIKAENKNSFDFKFFINHKTYRLRIGAKPSFYLPGSLPFGFKFKSKWRQHFLSVSTLK